MTGSSDVTRIGKGCRPRPRARGGLQLAARGTARKGQSLKTYFSEASAAREPLTSFLSSGAAALGGQGFGHQGLQHMSAGHRAVTKLGSLGKVNLLNNQEDKLVVRSREMTGRRGSTPSLATTSLLFYRLLQFKSKRLRTLFFAFADQEHRPSKCKRIRKIGRGREQPHRAWRRSHFGGGYFPILGLEQNAQQLRPTQLVANRNRQDVAWGPAIRFVYWSAE